MSSVPVHTIKSKSNPSYRRFRQYLLRPEAEACPWVAVEGRKQVCELSQDRSIQVLLVEEMTEPLFGVLAGRSKKVIRLSRKLLHGLSKTRAPQGLLAFFEKPKWSWNQITPYVLYLNRLQDPGNLGVLLRTASATGIFSIVTSAETVSCFNDKVVRASSGYLFKTPFMEKVKALELKQRGYKIWMADPREGESLFEGNFKPPLAFMLGNEGQGLGLSLAAVTGRCVRIPMSSRVESLSAAVSGSLLMYEIWRKVGVDE